MYLEGKVAPYSWSPEKLKNKIIQEGLIEEKCSVSVGILKKERLDLKAPLNNTF